MQPQYVAGMGHIVSQILAGEEVSFDRYTDMLTTIVGPERETIRTDEDGNIDIPDGSYAIVNMKGPVIKYGDWCNWGADEITRALYKMNSIPAIKGIILDTDGPGGSVSAIGPFLEFAKNKQKPVVALIDMAASLHYWTTVAVSDHMMVDNNVSAMVGSVGVVISFADTKPYYEEKGIVFHEIYPPESEDKNLSFRNALDGDYKKIIEEHLSPLARKFQNAVRSGRPNLKEKEGVLTGKTFYAEEALDLGMIDSIGSMTAAMDEVDRLAFKQAASVMFN